MGAPPGVMSVFHDSAWLIQCSKEKVHRFLTWVPLSVLIHALFKITFQAFLRSCDIYSYIFIFFNFTICLTGACANTEMCIETVVEATTSIVLVSHHKHSHNAMEILEAWQFGGGEKP